MKYNLVIYDYDGEVKATFPLERTVYDEFFGKLHVEHDGGLQIFRLDRYSYAVEKR